MKFSDRGDTFGRLTLISRVGRVDSDFIWECKCSCGLVVSVRQKSLANGKTKSCGCFQKEAAKVSNKTHGKSYSSEYESWSAMHTRCSNPRQRSFKDYGAKGIVVCARWDNFENFLEDMGSKPTPKHTLERKDNNLGYSSENCKWATRRDQNRNTSKTVWATIAEVRKPLVEWCEERGLSVGAVRQRIVRGATPELAIEAATLAKKKREPIISLYEALS